MPNMSPSNSSDSSSNQGSQSSTGPPTQRPRWMYARGKGWATFTPQDDELLEQRWQELGGAEWAAQIKARRDKQEQQAKEEKQKEKEKSDHHHQEQGLPNPRQVKPVAPPTGVEAVRSALSDFKDAPSKAKKQVKEATDQASGTITPPINRIKRAIFGAESKQQDSPESRKKHGDDKDQEKQEPDSHYEKTQDGTGKVMVNEVLDPDEPQSERRTKVEVMEDKLFDVDLERMVLYPVFWKGVLLKVVRATWFYSSSSDGSYAPIACDDALSHDLDQAYAQAEPWKYANNQEKDADKKEKKDNDDEEEEADASKLFPLPSIKDAGKVRFTTPEIGRIFSEDLKGRFLSVLGGSIVVRGFDKAEELARQHSNDMFSFSLPWAADDEDTSDSDAEGSDSKKSRKQIDQEKGSTFGARSASRRQGAAKTGGTPQAGGGADGSSPQSASTENDKDDRQSFAARIIPSSDSITRPVVALLRMLGYSKEDAAEEGKRQVKQKATEDEVDRQRESAGDDGESEPEIEEDLKDSPPELVFAIHGIGQQLTEDFDALDFVYDVERLRNLSNKQATDVALRKLGRGKRAQFIPICWRRSLKFDERPDHNDNFYTLDDVTNSAAIPMVRNVISKVVLDVPFYLSHHKQKMIDSVIAELNRTYRLFCRRNPDFEKKGGRVSIIGHSLGSALSADILSIQPTRVPPLYELGSEEKKENKHLHFNVKNLFLIGSPVGFFFYLDGGQLIARRGTLRSQALDSESDAALETVGKYGCLATETVYNIYNPTDPVAFLLSPTVDKLYASVVQPVQIADAAGALLESLALPRLSVTKLFSKYGAHPFDGVGKLARLAKAQLEEDSETRDEKVADASDFIHKVRLMHELDESTAVATERGDEQKRIQPARLASSHGKGEDEYDLEALERGERRFRALNPHGCIDFALSSSIAFSEYLDMIGAHVSYWTHPDFATFVLTQLFSDWTDDHAVTLVPEVATQDEQQLQQQQQQQQQRQREEEEKEEEEKDDDDDDDK